MRYKIGKTTGMVVAALVLLMSGCSREVGIDTKGEETTKDVSVRMTLDVPTATATRGLSSMQQDAVRFVDILVFDKNMKLTDWQYGVLDDNSGVISFSALLKSSKDNNDKFRIMALVNARETTYHLFKGANFGGYKGESYANVRTALAAAVPSYSDLTSKGIPMWGELKDPVLINNANRSYNMNILRSLARIDVGTNPNPTFTATGQIASWTVLSNFSLEEIHVYNTNTKYALAPDRDNNYDFDAKRVTTFTIPSPNSKAASAIEYSDAELAGTITRSLGKGISATGSIYAGESNVKMGGTYADSNHPNRMALVVAGYYSPDPNMPNTTDISYYRLDFTEGVNGTTLMDILRNNDYQVVIQSVSGPGSETKEKAFEKFNANITAVIKTWTNAGQSSTVIEGQNWLSVDRHDIKMDKWAKSHEQVTVTTNISSAWSATVIEGSTWLTLMGGPTITGGNGDAFKFSLTEIPTATPPRTGKIRITAGTMSLVVMVLQTDDQGVFHLLISDSELLFAGRKWDKTNQSWGTPDDQVLNIKWAPYSNDFGMSLAPYVGGGIVGFSPPSTSGNSNTTVSVDAIDPADPRVEKDPFFERSSLLTVTAWNLDGTENISKKVLIRQVFYSLVISGNEDYYYQNKSYTFNLKSNSAWVAEVSGANIFVSDPSASGTGNVSSGENFTFKISTTATPNSSATITFRSPGNLFPPQEFTIVVQDEHPNSYFLTPNTGTIKIPVSKAYRVWKYDRDLKDIHADGNLPGGGKNGLLLWQDAQNLISNVEFSPAPSPGQITVTAGSGTGNAVVAFTIGGTVYWSWHIWVTDHSVINSTDIDGRQVMDRHIGATNATPGDIGTIGLVYEGGRKDPFPMVEKFGSAAFKTIYNKSNQTLDWEVPNSGGITFVTAPVKGGLPMAVNNPLIYYKGGYGTFNWSGQLTEPRVGLWNSTIKSDYDPCPKGWRIYNPLNYDGMNAVPFADDGFIWRGAYFPAQGYFDRVKYGNGTIASFYTVGVPSKASPRHNLPRSIGATKAGAINGSNVTSIGAPVRCIRDL